MKSEEIAKLAKVSRSTVSRVLNNYPNVPKETYDKVMKIIEEYNYEPNVSAQVLAGKRTNIIGLFIISISDSENPNRIYNNNYFAPFLDAVVDRANFYNNYVLVNTIYNEKEYAKIKQAFLQKRMDSIIIVGMDKDSDYLLDIIKMNFPVAVIDFDTALIPKDNHNLTVINTTDYEGTCCSVEYLIRLGHKKIGILNGRMTTFSGKERFRAFTDTMKKHNIPICDELILEGNFIDKDAAKCVKSMINKGNIPTAMFCANDSMALSAIKVFNDYGYSVPDNISIVGFDDAPISGHINPALTTMKIPVYQMADKAVSYVIKKTKNKKLKNEIITMPTELIIRDSCKNIN